MSLVKVYLPSGGRMPTVHGFANAKGWSVEPNGSITIFDVHGVPIGYYPEGNFLCIVKDDNPLEEK